MAATRRARRPTSTHWVSWTWEMKWAYFLWAEAHKLWCTLARFTEQFEQFPQKERVVGWIFFVRVVSCERSSHRSTSSARVDGFNNYGGLCWPHSLQPAPDRACCGLLVPLSFKHSSSSALAFVWCHLRNILHGRLTLMKRRDFSCAILPTSLRNARAMKKSGKIYGWQEKKKVPRLHVIGGAVLVQ